LTNAQYANKQAMISVRDYNPATDFPAPRTCFVELQAWEHGLEPSLPEPESVADAYLADMLHRCATAKGRVFVADAVGQIVGFLCLMARVAPELDEPPEPYSYISDLVVRAAYRDHGAGKQLIAHAEAFARQSGALRLKVGVLVRNDGAHRLYRSCGFRDYTVQLLKEL
jgi:ribosomal protein S18 acetylase RimI-like enzyme